MSSETSFVLIRRLADGTVEWIPLEVQSVTVVPDAAYTLVDRADYEAPDALVAQRRGEDLVVEVQGNEVVVLRGFYTNADVTFYPTTNIAGGAGPFSGSPLTADSPVLAGSSAGEQVVWSAEPTGGKAVAAASEQAGAGSTAPAAGGAVAGSSGGGSPLLWVGVAAGGLGLAAAAGGGGGGSSGGGGPPVVVDTVAPTITSGTTATAIAENSGAGQVVYTTTATDAGTISYSLRAVGDAAAFTINANTGAVTLTGNPNFETKSTYTFTVAATDQANNSSERAVTLAINNRDEVAPTITSGTTATAINENSGAGQVVYTVTSTDTGDISTGNTNYSLSAAGDGSSFTIDANTGAVTLAGNPDFETKPSYNFTVVATDVAGNSSQTAVSLAINDSVDESTPTVGSVALTGATGRVNNTLNVGDTVQVTVTMSEATTVGGTPRIALNVGGTTVQANYVSGSGSTNLVFQYTVQAGNTDANGISIAANSLQANGGSLTDAAGNAAVLTHSAVADNASFLVDTTAPTVGNVALTGATGRVNNTLNVGDTAQVTVTMSEATTVGGTPRIALNVGGTTVQANYVSGSGSTNLVFQYTVQAGNTDANGISIAANSLQANGGSLTDAAGNAAVLTHSAVADNASFLVDTTAPAVGSVALSGATGRVNNTLNVGDTVQVTVTMSEATTVGGTPRIALNVGGTTVQANYVSGSGSTNLVFQYTVQAGNTDANGISIAANSLQANGGSLTDAAGNAAVLTHSAVADNASFLVDTTASTVSHIGLTGAIGGQNGSLNAGDIVSATVTMTENTLVNTSGGTPTIELSIGGDRVDAVYASGSGTPDLIFQYTIQPGEDDNNGISFRANTLALNGGSIADAAGNVADLDHGSVISNPSFIVDTTAPSLSSSSPPDDAQNVSTSDDIVLTFNDDVQAGSGNIIISDGFLDTRSIDVTGPQVSINNNQVTIDPGVNLAPFRPYSIQIDAGAFTDEAGNGYAGISNNTTLNFETGFAFPFALAQGSSLDSGRMFQSESEEIDIRLAVDDPTLTSSDIWGGSASFGSDDRASLVAKGADALDPSAATNQMSFTDAAAGFDATTSIVDAFVDGAVGQTNINSFASMPAVIVTSQGLA